MERHEILEAMTELKLYGVPFADIISTSVTLTEYLSRAA